MIKNGSKLLTLEENRNKINLTILIRTRLFKNLFKENLLVVRGK